jgi:methionyl-tRNA formyltransferase
MRIIFAGSPAIAVPSLERLYKMYLDGKIELTGILTNADAPKGRKGTPEPTEIALAAEEFSSMLKDTSLPLPVVFKPEKLDAAFRESVSALKPDLLVSFAYGKIFGPKFLELFPLGGINIHPSILPKYRGPSPITAAILHREGETGITIQKLAKEMDAGDILLQEKFSLQGTETTDSLSDDVALKSAVLLEQIIEKFLVKNPLEEIPHGNPQDHTKAVYCKLIERDDGIISWDNSALQIDAQIRAFNPWPLARTKHEEKALYILEAKPLLRYPETDTAANASSANGTVLGIDKDAGILVKTNDGILAVTRLQYAGKKVLDWRSFLNGARNFVGSVLG